MAAALRFLSSIAAKTPDFLPPPMACLGSPILFPPLSSTCLELPLPTIPLVALDEEFGVRLDDDAAPADAVDEDDAANAATDAPKDIFFGFDSPVRRIGGAVLLLCIPLPTAPCRDLFIFTSCRSALILAVPLLLLRPVAAAAIFALGPLDLFKISSCRDCLLMVVVFLLELVAADLIPTWPIFGRSECKSSRSRRIFSPCLAILAASRSDKV